MASSPWSPPRGLPKLGDISCSRIYRQVGWALTQWEELEFWLSLLFVDIYPKVGNPPEFDYGRLPNYSKLTRFDLRSDCLEKEFARLQCDQSNESRLGDIMNRARLLSQRRNDIAHGAVRHIGQYGGGYQVGVSPPTQFTSANFGFFLVPISDLARRMLPTLTKEFLVYTSEEIRDYGEHFSRLVPDVRMFMYDVFGISFGPP